MKQLQTIWLKHLSDPDHRENLEKTIRNNSVLFKRVLDILAEMEQSILSEERTKTQYETPSWAYLQAHKNGSLETLKKLKDLFSLT